LGLKFIGDIRSTLNDTALVSIGKIGLVLLNRRNPTITDKKTLEIPLALTTRFDILITSLDGLGNVRNILTGVRFTGEIKL
jgi:hypothetical protein